MVVDYNDQGDTSHWTFTSAALHSSSEMGKGEQSITVVWRWQCYKLCPNYYYYYKII